MYPRNPTAVIFAIIALAYLAGATQSVGDRQDRYMRQDVMHQDGIENYSRGVVLTSTRPHWRRDRGVHVFYRLGARSLSINCSSARCLVVLTNADES